jgi:hypothetical protein
MNPLLARYSPLAGAVEERYPFLAVLGVGLEFNLFSDGSIESRILKSKEASGFHRFAGSTTEAM